MYLDISENKLVSVCIATDYNLAREQRSKSRRDCNIRIIMKLNQIPFNSSYTSNLFGHIYKKCLILSGLNRDRINVCDMGLHIAFALRTLEIYC